MIGEEQLRDRYKQEPKLSFVVKAIYTMAHGLHNMIQDVCGTRGFCKEIFPFNGSLFKVIILPIPVLAMDEISLEVVVMISCLTCST